MEKRHVWEFTNQKKLTKKEFLTYFEKKVFKTIRKNEIFPKDKVFRIKKGEDINTAILKKILETKFEVKESTRPNISSENSSDIAEKTFEEILKGKFKKGKGKNNRPLYFHSDKEIKLYAKLTNTKGEEKKRNKKIQDLFRKFIDKNQDLELNILKAVEQIK